MTKATRFTVLALLFEGGLGLLAAALGWLFGQPPWETLRVATASQLAESVLWGVAATLPMVAALVWLDRRPVGPWVRMKRFVDEQLVPLFAGLSWSQLGLISLAAGIGEEMLFRGLLQAGLAAWIGPPAGLAAGLVVASVLFGVCHWLTTDYALLATLIGFYLGGLFLLSDNLLAPVVAHALYDFVALLYLVKGRRPETSSS